MEPETASEAIVRQFCNIFSGRDVDKIMEFFTEDAVYHNIPMAPATGADAIREMLQLFVPGSPSIEFEILNMGSTGSVVFAERIDRMTFNAKVVELPVVGVFETFEGKIRAWRDYFDMQMFLGAGDGQ